MVGFSSYSFWKGSSWHFLFFNSKWLLAWIKGHSLTVCKPSIYPTLSWAYIVLFQRFSKVKSLIFGSSSVFGKVKFSGIELKRRIGLLSIFMVCCGLRVKHLLIQLLLKSLGVKIAKFCGIWLWNISCTHAGLLYVLGLKM